MVSEPAHNTASVRRQQSGRDRARASNGRRRWTWLAVVGLTLAVSALGSVGVWAIRRESANPEAIWKQAEADLGVGRFEQVEAAVAQLSRLREPTPLDWLLRGQIAIARNRPREAFDALARVPDHHYMAPQARLMVGQIDLRRNRLRFAEAAFHEAVRLDPKLVQAHRELIYIYGMHLRRAELNAEFNTLASLTTLKFEEAFHWCLLRNDSWEPAEAAPMLASYVAADPGDRWSRLALSYNDRRMGLLDEAESALEGLAPDDPEVIEARARIAFDRNDEPLAERLLASGPADHPVLARLRGRLALSPGRKDARAALHHFRIAYAADPENRETLAGLISALVSTGDDQAAAPLREVARKLALLSSLVQRAGAKGTKDDPRLPRQLGDACAGLNRVAEARAWYQVAIARDPLDSQAQQALFQLGPGPHDRHPALPGSP
jgi:tetratricopeptide (TPR) repeat protein